MINFEITFIGIIFLIVVLAAIKQKWIIAAIGIGVIVYGLNVIKRKGSGAFWDPTILQAKVLI